MCNHQGGQGVGLVLTGVPGHRRGLKAGEVPGHAGGAGFEALKQRRRPGYRVAAASTRARVGADQGVNGRAARWSRGWAG